jgi:lysophospholipase L1-like esterase
MTTCPTHARWETYGELEQAAATVAKEKQTALADVAATFRAAGSADDALKQNYWCDDKVHLGAKGHEVAKDAALKVIEAER